MKQLRKISPWSKRTPANRFLIDKGKDAMNLPGLHQFPEASSVDRTLSCSPFFSPFGHSPGHAPATPARSIGPE